MTYSMTEQEKTYCEMIKAGFKLEHNKEHKFYFMEVAPSTKYLPATAIYFSESFINN